MRRGYLHNTIMAQFVHSQKVISTTDCRVPLLFGNKNSRAGEWEGTLTLCDVTITSTAVGAFFLTYK